jgi:hypothetical protein
LSPVCQALPRQHFRPNTIKRATPQGSALPKKGSLEDAGRGEKTLVTMTWECRQQPIILKGTVHLPSKTRIIQPITISMPAPVRAVPVKASQMMVDAVWVSMVESACVLPEHILAKCVSSMYCDVSG